MDEPEPADDADRLGKLRMRGSSPIGRQRMRAFFRGDPRPQQGAAAGVSSHRSLLPTNKQRAGYGRPLSARVGASRYSASFRICWPHQHESRAGVFAPKRAYGPAVQHVASSAHLSTTSRGSLAACALGGSVCRVGQHIGPLRHVRYYYEPGGWAAKAEGSLHLVPVGLWYHGGVRAQPWVAGRGDALIGNTQ